MSYKKIFCIGLTFVSIFVEAETLVDVYQLALKNDNELKAAHSQYFIDKQSEDVALSRLLPQISLEGTYGHSSSARKADSSNPFAIDSNKKTNTDTSGYSISITQPIFDLSSYRLYQGAVFKGTRANTELKNKEQKLILRVADAYLQLLKAKADYKALTGTEQAFLHQFEQVKLKYSLGLARIAEVNEAKSSYDSAVANSILGQNTIDIQLELLTVMTGAEHKGSSQFLPDTSVPVTPMKMSAKEWLKLANENNLDIKIAEYKKKEAKKDFQAQSNKHLPTVSARLGYSDNNEDSTFNYTRPSDVSREEWNAALVLTVPIYSGGSVSALTREAKHRYYLQKDLLNQTKREVNQLINSSYLDLLSGSSALKAREVAVKSSEISLQSIKRDYDSGLSELKELLDAQRAVFIQKQSYYDALYTYLVAELKLKEAAGVISVEDLFELNKKLSTEASVQGEGT
ncbi:TolC family outer membrane protein [Thalassomonas viridans]|uniref:TolC family outer membrane protein n=1 Tax=Thalassomonas viridans TaxID=137584 RepID=A0AAE9ZGA5_9GAMM|nr:TolC family outer membrane protein [Thalassomonas viridans]WDE09212.1 TolC family outer membrane protein [Thalassomonas viridans]